MKTQSKILLAVLVAYVLYLVLGQRRYEPFQDAAAAKVVLKPKTCSTSKDCPSRFECRDSKCVDTRFRVA
jgi:hypothetical protein